jgi:anti-anti-sigma factor
MSCGHGACSSKLIMLRITKNFEDENAVILRLDGRIDSTTLDELQNECDEHRRNTQKTLLLDLSGVTFISQSGLKLLQKLKNGRVKLAKGSLFVETLLSELKDR